MFTLKATTVLCAGCGELIAEGANHCTQCGAPRPREPFFYPVSVTKLAFFGATTFSLYVFWWFWSQWRADAPREGRFYAGVKTIFCPIFFYSIAQQAKDAAAKQGIACRYSPVLLSALFLAMWVAVDRLPGDWVLVPVLLLPAPLIPAQIAINRVNASACQDQPRAWRRWEKVTAGVLGVLWALILLLLLVPVPAEEGEAPAGTDVTQTVPPAPASHAPAMNLPLPPARS